MGVRGKRQNKAILDYDEPEMVNPSMRKKRPLKGQEIPKNTGNYVN